MLCAASVVGRRSQLLAAAQAAADLRHYLTVTSAELVGSSAASGLVGLFQQRLLVLCGEEQLLEGALSFLGSAVACSVEDALT